ncbi:ABC transporter substrate-binding protein [Halovulum sp. GXIMD14793]
MIGRGLKATLLASAFTALVAGGPASAQELRMMWYSDGVEGEVMQDLLDRFMEANPDITVVLDNVSYKVIKEQLPITLAAGEGPDIARVTDLKDLSEHWLDLTPYVADPAVWQANFGDQADWMRPDGSDAILGFMTQLTLTGGYANKTLFEQAGVDLPGPDATWDEWVEAADKVAKDQGLAAAFTIDRSGHRMTGPAVSFGANYIGEDGMPASVDDGVKEFVSRMVKWTEEGKNLRDVWVAASGSTYRAGADEFINANVPYYYSGNWQIANLSSKIGDGFDWVATGSPCGPAACSGMAGGAALVAVKYTKHPEAVGKLMDYLASAEMVKEFSERTLFLPAHKGVVEAGGLNFVSDDPNVGAALEAFVAASARQSPIANKLPAWKWSGAYYNALVTRTSQAMAGEMSLEDAYSRMDADIAEQVKQAGQ